MFEVEGFYEALNEHRNLIGFENGVYDLKTDTFRAGLPEDMITFTTGYDYNPIVDTKIRRDIMDFFESIFDSKEVMNFALWTMAMNMHGYKKHHMIFMWTGRGGNGKSISINLLKRTFGRYFYNVSSDLFTTKRKSSSAANPELAQAKGVRFMFANEPEKGSMIYVGLLKEMSGNDEVQARRNFDKDFTGFKLQACPVITANELPVLSGSDGGTKRRIYIIMFPFNFVEKPTFAHEKQIDITLGEKFDDVNYAQQMFLILKELYSEYRLGGYKVEVPQSVIDASNEYLDENNFVKQFVTENYEPKKGGMTIANDMWKEFKYWAKENGVVTGTQRGFNDIMKGAGYRKDKHRNRGDIGFYDKEVFYGIVSKCLVDEDNGDDIN
jgi:P4 family phage/plasmid primase-like protien